MNRSWSRLFLSFEGGGEVIRYLFRDDVVFAGASGLGD